jgi:hypothetical protein
MDDGEVGDVGPGDVFDVPPGHDAWVVGDEAVVALDVLGRRSSSGARTAFVRRFRDQREPQGLIAQ